MKIRSLILSIATTLTTMAAVAQTNGFSYQAVVRNSKGELVSNKNVGLRITLTDKDGKQNFYQEANKTNPNEYQNFGLIRFSLVREKSM